MTTTIEDGEAGDSVRTKLNNDLAAWINVKDYGAVGDGTSHLLSEYYGSLAAAQAVYPFVTSLSQTIDYAGIQAAVDWNTVYAVVTAPSANGDTTINIDSTPATLTATAGTGSWTPAIVGKDGTFVPGTTVSSVAANVVTVGQGVRGAGIAISDVIRFDFKDRGTIFIPPGSYKIGSDSIKLWSGASSNQMTFRIIGTGDSSYIEGSTSAYIFDRSPVYKNTSGQKEISNLSIRNTNSTGGGIRLSSTVGGVIRNLRVVAHKCINTTSGTSITTVVPTSGGSGYALGDTITITGGTGTACVLVVNEITGGVISLDGTETATPGVCIRNGGDYSAFPGTVGAGSATNCTGTTSGSGTGATFSIYWAGASQGVSVHDVSFDRGGSAADSFAICMGASGFISNIDTTAAFGRAVILYGIGPQVTGFRLENNTVGFALGCLSNGEAYALSNFALVGGSMESNLTHIMFESGGAGLGLISSINFHAGQPCTYGIRAPSDKCSRVLFNSLAIGGNYSGATYSFAGTSLPNNSLLIGCSGTNSGSGSSEIIWDLPLTGYGPQFINSDTDTPIPQFELLEDFYGTWDIAQTYASRHWSSTAGAGAGTAAAATVADSRCGEITLLTSTANSTHAANASVFSGRNASFRSQDSAIELEVRIKCSPVTSVAMFVGFSDTISTTVEMPIYLSGATVLADATAAAGVGFDTNGTTVEWFMAAVAGGVTTAATYADFAPTNATYTTIRVRIAVNAVRAWVNGKPLNNASSINGPGLATMLTPYVVVCNRSASQRTATIDYIKVRQNRIAT